MTFVIIFFSSFLTVFLYGFQSQVVRDKQKKSAFLISIGIGVMQLYILKSVPDATFYEGIAFIIGGASGIVASIEAHIIWMKHVPRKDK